MVTDYDAAGTHLLYSTSDIFTHRKFEDKKVLILYACVDGYNEFAVRGIPSQVKQIEKGAEYNVGSLNSSEFLTVGWTASPNRNILSIGDLYVYLLDRNSAYNYWVTPTGINSSNLITNGPYLVRSASIDDGTLSVKADLNVSTTIEFIGAPPEATTLLLNNKQFVLEHIGVSAIAEVDLPTAPLDPPVLAELNWKYLDTLPEVKADYDDSLWTALDQTYTNNTFQALINPISLYAADYGYNNGMLIYRGHFNATGYEKNLAL
ncbi:hypothetical protein QQX98_010506 [Neonectria punicea]|uniref:Uncharacterized protein n=1 Tax=Neonectria punicea TaxID=979145 RepID=A0ABR1GPN9_9HYPO